jgi:aminopeptidase
MIDSRITRLAKLLIEHSCGLTRGERVLIEGIDAPREIIVELLRQTTAVGAIPLVAIKDEQVNRELCAHGTADGYQLLADIELHALKQMDAFISVRAPLDAQEYPGLPAEKLRLVLEHYIKPVHHEYRNDNVRWVALRWPTPAMAQRAGMSLEAFEDFFFSVCCADYQKMSLAMDPLIELMEQTNTVRIKGPGETDLTFSIAGTGQYKSDGHHNIPDGELFTAPVRDSINGRIVFNVPSVYYGTCFENVCLDFQRGKIVKAVCNDTRRLNDVLDQDEGARFIGEFAFGVNPMITSPMKDILFDEKIAGSIHLAAGNAYRECDNGNRSAIHWDLILIQTPEHGGGEIYFDSRLIRKDGRFVLPELAGLNPEALQ